MFSFPEFCCGYLPTLYTVYCVHSVCFILQTRHVLVLYFAFVIAVFRNADSLKLIKLFIKLDGKGLGPGWVKVSAIVF